MGFLSHHDATSAPFLVQTKKKFNHGFRELYGLCLTNGVKILYITHIEDSDRGRGWRRQYQLIEFANNP